jgi:hypothetical protein
MLPSEPKIFHGRDTELSEILKLFGSEAPRIAILGGGGIGKTSLAKVVVHHPDIIAKYEQHRHFVGCDSATNQVELAGLIGVHLGLKPANDLTRLVVRQFSGGPKSILILDNLETSWEPTESREKTEEFLSLLTDVDHLALMVSWNFFVMGHALMVCQITMRGSERPLKVRWTRPFLLPLNPLTQEAALKTFLDIADDRHDPIEVDKTLALTNNIPLAINLMSYLVDSEGCVNILSRWESEKTSLMSEGYDRRSNLDVSISLSLSSPRISSVPHSQELLSLLSILPDGLSDVELVQSKLPVDDIFSCKIALVRTALAYNDSNKRLKVLVPVREHMQKIHPPGDHFMQPLFKYFQGMLQLFKEYRGTQSVSAIVDRISLNYVNIQNVLESRLQPSHPDLENGIYCICYLNEFSRFIGYGCIPLIVQTCNFLPLLFDYRLSVYLIVELICSLRHYPIPNPDNMASKALEHLEGIDDTDLKCMSLTGLIYSN